jgi:hypothetical protein
MITHPSDRLWAEVVRVAYHLHWSLDDVMNLAHHDRARILHEIEILRAESPVPSGRR